MQIDLYDGCKAVIGCDVVQHAHTHARTHARMHTHTFNGPLFGTAQVSRYQKGKTYLDFTEAMASAGLYASLHLAPVK